jgi:DNA-binding NarL/FixJ family response regulator
MINSKRKFTKKEMEIIKLVCRQFSNKEIAARLYLGTRTIEGYRKKIQQKMKVKNTAGMAVFAVKNHIF